MGLRLFQVYRNKFYPRLIGRGAIEIINTDVVTNVEATTGVNTTAIEGSLQETSSVSFYRKTDTTSIEGISSQELPIGIDSKLDSTNIESIVQYPVDKNKEHVADMVRFEGSVSGDKIIFEISHTDQTAVESMTMTRIVQPYENVNQSSLESLESTRVKTDRFSSDIVRFEDILSRKTTINRKSIDVVSVENSESLKKIRYKVTLGRLPIESFIGKKGGIGKLAIDRVPLEQITAKTRNKLKTTINNSHVENFISRKNISQNYGRSVDRALIEEFFYSKRPLSTSVVGVSQIEQIESLDKIHGVSRADRTKVESVVQEGIYSISRSIDVTKIEQISSETASLNPIITSTTTEDRVEDLTSVVPITSKYTLDVHAVEGTLMGEKIIPIERNTDLLRTEALVTDQIITRSIQNTDEISIESTSKVDVRSTSYGVDCIKHEGVESSQSISVEEKTDSIEVESISSDHKDGSLNQMDQIRQEGIVSIPTPINLEDVVGTLAIEGNESIVKPSGRFQLDSVVIAGVESFGANSINSDLSASSLESLMSCIHDAARQQVENALGEHIISKMSPGIRLKMENMMMEQIVVRLKRGYKNSGDISLIESFISEPPIPPYSGKGSSYIKTISLETAVVPSKSYIFSKIFVERVVSDISALYVSIYLDYFTSEVSIAETNGFGTSVYIDSLVAEASYGETNGFGSVLFTDSYLTEVSYAETDYQSNIFIDSLTTEVCFS